MTDSVDGAFGVRNRIVDAFGRILRHFDVREHLFNFCLDTVNINITYHDDTLLVRTIPLFIVVTECLRLEIVNHFHCADWQTVGIL